MSTNSSLVVRSGFNRTLAYNLIYISTDTTKIGWYKVQRWSRRVSWNIAEGTWEKIRLGGEIRRHVTGTGYGTYFFSKFCDARCLYNIRKGFVVQ